MKLVITVLVGLVGVLSANDEKSLFDSPLFDLKKKLLDYYMEPPQTGSQVLSAAVFYLHELTRLQEAVAEKVPNAREILIKVDEDGGPQHLKTIPYAKLIDKYSWEAGEIGNYHSLVSHTRRVWDELLVQELGREGIY